MHFMSLWNFFYASLKNYQLRRAFLLILLNIFDDIPFSKGRKGSEELLILNAKIFFLESFSVVKRRAFEET